MIRPATAADAPALAAVQMQAWQHGYADVVDLELILQAPPEDRTHLWRGALEPGADARAWVDEHDGEVAGFAAAGAARDAAAPAGAGELHALFVRPAAQGAGVGTALLAHVVEVLRADGHATGTLRVLERNSRARRFYERHGWREAPDGAVTGEWGDELRYERALPREPGLGRTSPRPGIMGR